MIFTRREKKDDDGYLLTNVILRPLGHLDSRSSIRRVLLATSLIALAFTITQGTLELVLPDDTFHIPSRDFYVFGHGGMMFWFCSSLVFTTVRSLCMRVFSLLGENDTCH